MIQTLSYNNGSQGGNDDDQDVDFSSTSRVCEDKRGHDEDNAYEDDKSNEH